MAIFKDRATDHWLSIISFSFRTVAFECHSSTYFWLAINHQSGLVISVLYRIKHHIKLAKISLITFSRCNEWVTHMPNHSSCDVFSLIKSEVLKLFYQVAWKLSKQPKKKWAILYCMNSYETTKHHMKTLNTKDFTSIIQSYMSQTCHIS